MTECGEFRFINGASQKSLLVVEPASSEFWIASKATVRVVLEGGVMRGVLDVEYLPNGRVVYAGEGSQFTVYQDGHLLTPGRKSRRMASQLNGPLG